MSFQLKYANELNKLKEDENNIEFFKKIALDRNNPEQMKEVIHGLLDFSNENNLKNVKAWAYYYLGWYNFDKSFYKKASEYFLKSNDLFEATKNHSGLIYACNGLTNIYCQIGHFKLSNEWGLKGISLCEETGNKEALIVLLINTGINYVQMKYFSKGREVFHSLEAMDCELTKSQQISCKLALAEIEINIGEPKLALSYIATALKIEEELQIITDVSEIYKLEGMAFAKLKLYDLAEKSFRMSYEFSEENGLIYEKCCAMVEWSKLQKLVGRSYEAINLLNEVIGICSSKELTILLREGYHLLYEIYKNMKKSDMALAYLENYITINDKMYDFEQGQLMVKLNIKHTKQEADKYKSLYDKTELLSTIGQKIISNLNIESIIDIINHEINKLIKADYLEIAVYDEEKDQAGYYFVGEDLKIQEVVKFKEKGNNTFGAFCLKHKRDIIIGNTFKEYKKYFENEPMEFAEAQGKSNMLSMVYTPMVINDKVVGLMTVQNKEENAYGQNDLNTLKILANYSAIAIENAISYKKIEDIATYDNLTNFLTKFEITRLGEIIYDKCKAINAKFSVTMIDIDNFKTINDTYGHVLGDRAISKIALTISKCIRNTDYIGRYGGDEFLLICPGTGEVEAYNVAERIRSCVENEVYDLGDGIKVMATLSLGVHEFNLSDLSFMDVVKVADKNLYNAKENNRNLVICN